MYSRDCGKNSNFTDIDLLLIRISHFIYWIILRHLVKWKYQKKGKGGLYE